ncbi:TonB-dependent receptor plug domain-containing protein [bacterium]|nr:TonB-dependent receptor plug domain-containing protein [bacterium]
MKSKVIWSLLLVLVMVKVSFAQEVTVSGTITDYHSGEPIVGATVYDSISARGAVSNPFGFYSITLPVTAEILRVSFLGYKTQYVEIQEDDGKKLNIALVPFAKSLKEVVVTADKVKVEEEVESTQMSVVKLSPLEVSKIPSLGGEVDLIKVAQLMPGVAKGGEGQSGMFVRGGTADQNLVVLDDATVYNLGHLFGFFSVFNNEAIRDVTLYTGAFPAQFGGRLSAVMDVRMNEGTTEKFSASGGIGLLSSRLTLNIPVVKHKGGITISGRRTYIDKVFKTVGIPLPYYFYDLNVKGNYILSHSDRLYISSYLGNDVLHFSDGDSTASVQLEQGGSEQLNFGFKLGNFTSTLRWNHIYHNEKLFHNITCFQTRFKYDIGGSFLNNNVLIKSQIQDFGFKADWDYNAGKKHLVKFGAAVTNHAFRPNIVNTSGQISDYLRSREGNLMLMQEYGIYVSDDYKISNRLSVNSGLRLSAASTPKKVFGGLEPRFSAKYTLRKNNSVKLSYTRMKQYMHRVSSSSVVLPTDLWYPVTARVLPQASHQMALGFFGGIEKIKSNFSVEGYYKYMTNLIEYREGAQLLLNDNFEQELISGKGESYGLEFMFRRKAGRVTGWVAYTLSWAKRNFPDLNGGQTYYAKYDRRHYLSTVLMYELSERITFSSVWEYTTGARFTAQNGQYFMPNSSFTGIEIIPVYTARNAVVMAPSHRLDINIIIKSRQGKSFNGEWHFGIYNFYNRATPFRVNIQQTQFGMRYTQPGLFGLIPSIAYNFKF